MLPTSSFFGFRERETERTQRAVWPDLAKFCHFGKSLLVFSKFLTVYFLFGKMLSLLWQTCEIFGLIFWLQMAKYLKRIKSSGHTDRERERKKMSDLKPNNWRIDFLWNSLEQKRPLSSATRLLAKWPCVKWRFKNVVAVRYPCDSTVHSIHWYKLV